MQPPGVGGRRRESFQPVIRSVVVVLRSLARRFPLETRPRTDLHLGREAERLGMQVAAAILLRFVLLDHAGDAS